MIPRIDLMKFPARSAEPHQKLFWSNVLVIFNQSKPRELSHCRLLLSICFRCSKLLPSLWNWYFYQRSCFSFFFSGFEEQAGSIGIILELVIDQIIIVPYCYIFFTISSLSFFGTELYLRIVVKAVKVSVYSFNLFKDSQTDIEMMCVKESLKWQRWRWMEGVGGGKGGIGEGAVRGACYWLSFILRLSLVVFRTEQFWCIWNHVLKHL